MNFFRKNNIKILITDSGIGGLSIAEIIANKLSVLKSFKNVDIVYADSRENKTSGYNKIIDTHKRTDAFSKKLFELNEIYRPDIIFIACNTLSILYKDTDFFKKQVIPVIDIYTIGVNSILKYLNQNEDNNVFILGTKTTIWENSYKKSIIDYGYDEKRIANQMCPNLAKYIESGSDESLIDNVDWIVNRIIEKKDKDWKNFSISLNCTHYIYVYKLFKMLFKEHKLNIDIICPNFDMAEIFELYSIKNRFNKTNINFYICNTFKYNKEGIKRVKNFSLKLKEYYG